MTGDELLVRWQTDAVASEIANEVTLALVGPRQTGRQQNAADANKTTSEWLDSLATCPVNVDLIELIVNTRPDAVREIVYWAAVTRQRHNAASEAAHAYLAMEDRPAHRTGFWEGVLAVTEPEGEL